MPKFRFDKLVRDKIVDQLLASGARPHYRRLAGAEHQRELVQKIIEEAEEITHAQPDELAGEIADVQQALDDLKARHGLTDAAVKKAQAAKNAKAGAFQKGLYVDYVELDETDEWIAYYRKHPHKYPEVD